MVPKRSIPRKMLSGVSAVRAQVRNRFTLPGAGDGSAPSRRRSWLVVKVGLLPPREYTMSVIVAGFERSP
jgi:hypothetical protein